MANPIKNYTLNYLDYSTDDTLLDIVYKTRSNLVNIDCSSFIYTLPTATSSVLGGVKLISDTKNTAGNVAISGTPSADRTYGIQLNGSNKMVVYVPWVSYTITQPATNQIKFTPSSGTATTITINNVAVATKLGTATVGNATKPIYLNAGTPTAFSTTIGSVSEPVYLNQGTITKCTSVNADKVDNLHMLDITFAYANALNIQIGAVSLLAGSDTYANIMSKTSIPAGNVWYATDTDKYYRSTKNTTTASTSNWTDFTTKFNSAKALANQQTTTQDYLYVKITTNNSYFQKLVKFWVSANYDNVAGSTEIHGYCRATNQFYIDSVSYNGNKLLGIYQASANTNIYYLKLTKYLGGYYPDSYYASISVYSNITLTSLEFIGESHSDYSKVSAYNYITITNQGINTTNLWHDFLPQLTSIYSLGSSSFKWKYLYLSNGIQSGNGNTLGTTSFTGDVSGLTFTGTPGSVLVSGSEHKYTANTDTLSRGSFTNYVPTANTDVSVITGLENIDTAFVTSIYTGSGSLTSNDTSTEGIAYVESIGNPTVATSSNQVTMVGTYTSSTKNLKISLGGTTSFLTEVVATNKPTTKYLHHTHIGAAVNGKVAIKTTSETITPYSFTSSTINYANITSDITYVKSLTETISTITSTGTFTPSGSVK